MKLRVDATLIKNPVLECEHCDHRDCLNSFTIASILQGLGSAVTICQMQAWICSLLCTAVLFFLMMWLAVTTSALPSPFSDHVCPSSLTISTALAYVQILQSAWFPCQDLCTCHSFHLDCFFASWANFCLSCRSQGVLSTPSTKVKVLVLISIFFFVII